MGCKHTPLMCQRLRDQGRPSPIRAPPSPIRHPEQPRNDHAPPNNNSRGSRGNRASNKNQGANVSERPRYSQKKNRPAAHPQQPRQHNVPPPRMRNDGPRPIPRNHQRTGTKTNTHQEVSVGFSQSASSNSGYRERRPHHEPNLWEQLNQNRGLEAH